MNAKNLFFRPLKFHNKNASFFNRWIAMLFVYTKSNSNVGRKSRCHFSIIKIFVASAAGKSFPKFMRFVVQTLWDEVIIFEESKNPEFRMIFYRVSSRENIRS